MKFPTKPREPNHDDPPPSEMVCVSYYVYLDKDQYVIVRDGLSYEETRNKKLLRLSTLKKDLLLVVQDKFSEFDYTIGFSPFADDIRINVLEKVPKEEYDLSLKRWQNRFVNYEQDLEIYKDDLKKYREFKRQEEIKDLTDRIERLQKEIKILEEEK